jgi:hypothetical protein
MPVLAAQIARRHPGSVFLQHLDDLLFREPVLRIVCLLAGEQNPNLKSGAFQGSRSLANDR